MKDFLDERTETFDISDKVDTNNPIYKFYEKEVGRYLKNKYNAELVTDSPRREVVADESSQRAKLQLKPLRSPR